MPVRWEPDDPRWLTVAPDLAVVDLQVLREAGIPEPILLLAVRDAGPGAVPAARAPMLGRGDGVIPFDDVDDDPFAEYDRRDCTPRRRW